MSHVLSHIFTRLVEPQFSALMKWVTSKAHSANGSKELVFPPNFSCYHFKVAMVQLLKASVIFLSLSLGRSASSWQPICVKMVLLEQVLIQEP